MFKSKSIVWSGIGMLLVILFSVLAIVKAAFYTAPIPIRDREEYGNDILPTLTPSSTPVLPVNGDYQKKVPEAINSECIKTFESFVLEPDYWWKRNETTRIPPLTPWQVEGKVPVAADALEIERLLGSGGIRVEIARSIGGIQEVWIKGDNFYVYSPDTKLWRTVSRGYKDRNASIVKLFKMRDGSIWGQNEANSTQEKIPILSLYNEKTQQFEPLVSVLETTQTIIDPRSNYSPKSVVILDNQEMFWVFPPEGVIYQIDPKNLKTIKKIIGIQGPVSEAVSALDGSIYFQKEDVSNYLRFSDGDILQLFPETGKIVSLSAPTETWPMFMGYSMLVDHTNRLWLSSVGYRQSDGIWSFVFPEIREYFQHPGDLIWTPPVVKLESSDGRLWFYKATDMSSIDGTAWFDPKTNQGCVFTNVPAPIIEDANQTLWMIVDKTLYKYNLKR